MKAFNWRENYPNFSEEKFNCQETGKNEMKHETMLRFQKLRDLYGKPIIITSGFRDKTHSIEAKKKSPGSHFSGQAGDIRIDRTECFILLGLALKVGFTGIGFNQKGSGRFLHLDDIQPATEGFLRPTVWSY